MPKVAEPTRIKDLKPISLCNVIHRIFSKIITSRLSTFIEEIIFQEQGLFIKGRPITENVALAQELV